jgi:hypothetical protein
LFQQFGQLQ